MFMEYLIHKIHSKFFSSAQRTLFIVEHILGHKKKRFKKFPLCEIISSIFFSDYNGTKLDINYRKETGMNT